MQCCVQYCCLTVWNFASNDQLQLDAKNSIGTDQAYETGPKEVAFDFGFDTDCLKTWVLALIG